MAKAKKAKAKKSVAKTNKVKKPARKAASVKKSVQKKAKVQIKSKAKKTSVVKKPIAKKKTKSVQTVTPKKTKSVSADQTNAMVLSPLDDRILVQVKNEERMTAGGLFIPDSAAVSGNKKGTVVAVGRGHVSKKGHLHPVELQVGDQVLFAEYSGSKIQSQGVELIVLRESEVLGILET